MPISKIGIRQEAYLPDISKLEEVLVGQHPLEAILRQAVHDEPRLWLMAITLETAQTAAVLTEDFSRLLVNIKYKNENK